jgi:hypothetical protein
VTSTRWQIFQLRDPVFEVGQPHQRHLPFGGRLRFLVEQVDWLVGRQSARA